MISYLRQFLAFIPITILFYSCSSTPPETRTQERTASDDEIDSVALIYDPKKADPRYEDFAMRLHKRSSFNGNILVAKNGKIIYEKAIGWADHLHRDSLKINSVFELASVSKPFTSVGIMMLVEDGKLSLDQN